MALFTCSLILARFAFASSFAFLFIPWNMFLGVLPLYFAYRLNRAITRLAQFVWLALWLLFFPNAMYIVTDLFHLTSRPGVPKWYDLLILISAAINGIIMGFISLSQVEGYLHRLLGARYLKLITFCFFMLCGYGVYLGRYLRWNSWDIIVQPRSLATDIAYDIVHPFRNIECWLLTLLFGVWMYLLYGYFKKVKAGTEMNAGSDKSSAPSMYGL